MKQLILFEDLGCNRSFKEIWDLQEIMLHENVSLKSDRSQHSVANSQQPLVIGKRTTYNY